ncbi:MAG: acyl-CoA thioesterase [Vicinamibacterales bacterium]
MEENRANSEDSVNLGNLGSLGNLGNAFRYRRRVQFAETDLAGIVHFSCLFRYMEEAEHALWRAAGLSVAGPAGDLGWPRVGAAFEFRSPLRFEEEFEVLVRLAEVKRRSLHYEHTIVRGDTVIGTGTMSVVCVRKGAGTAMQAAKIPEAIVKQLQAVLSNDSG